MSEEPVINFRGYRILKVNYDIQKKENQPDGGELSVRSAISKDATEGQIDMSVSFANLDKERSGVITIRGSFDLRADLSESDKKRYLAINGAAMVYPYVRVIASVITGLDSSEVSALPSINFIDAYEKSRKNSTD